MSIFDLDASFERAARRLPSSGRRQRSDAGRARLSAVVERELERMLTTGERPDVDAIRRHLRGFCKRHGARVPSRATIYNQIARCRPPRYRGRALPAAVQEALYNVDLDAELDGAQIAFYAFNHGDLRAAYWAATMPWLALHHAARMRGWRTKSRGLLLAVLRRRRRP